MSKNQEDAKNDKVDQKPIFKDPPKPDSADVDEASRDSFPASDPPSWSPVKSVGPPDKEKPPTDGKSE